MKLKGFLSRYPFCFLFFLTIAVFGYLIFLYISNNVSSSTDYHKNLGIIAGVFLTVITLLWERQDNLINRRITLQQEFFNKWQSLKSELGKLNENSSKEKAFEKFSRYFELLDFEYIMAHHLNPMIFEEWVNSRIGEFKDEKIYAKRLFGQWWKDWSDGKNETDFNQAMNKLYDKYFKK